MDPCYIFKGVDGASTDKLKDFLKGVPPTTLYTQTGQGARSGCLSCSRVRSRFLFNLGSNFVCCAFSETAWITSGLSVWLQAFIGHASDRAPPNAPRH